ncbi:hypothetical protein B0T21DRAFT_279433 [Apiosordaria backusii]|uniref:Uncharacterized protein n=1 Tax=Apiosordaria backusii TaxID=314023 RepID=A0AA40K6Q8_9PEZI|nr:hypothetical protein B0T21DRAFT_279433 [Apiosordaria backusii]
MDLLGKIDVSGVAFKNENTVALVNINLDFSLWRCTPSPEFQPVGSALTIARKQEAETGELHRTACKLGFLFAEVIPDTPKLFKAFGTRVSEILSCPGINPQGTERDGPFQAFIGADCTSIWAAATSGRSSIGVLLLACMLADAWDAKSATSIWVELIEERRRKVQIDLNNGKLVNPHTNLASQQSYHRPELAAWDASARSWLRRAAASMKFQHTQLDLIAQNLNIPYPIGGSTYENVVLTWTRAMEVLENILQNTPQQACDRAVIRGISAWNLFPDLLVFQKEATKVSFSDSLFPNLALLSLGLEYKGQPSENFIRWSLALSHLKYYGDPVTVRSYEQLNRIHMPQFWLVVLGALFRRWEVVHTDFDAAMRWFVELGKVLSQVTSDCARISWLLRLCSAVTDIDGEDRNTAVMLVKYGWRRGTVFLGGSSGRGKHLAFFGLCSPRVMQALGCNTTIDAGIDYLRQVATSPRLNLEASDAIISYRSYIKGYQYTEWVTIYPVEGQFAGWDDYLGTWLHIKRLEFKVNNKIKRQLEERRRYLESIGENCIIVTEEKYLPDMQGGGTPTRSDMGELWWEIAPKLFDGYSDLTFFKAKGSWANLSHGFNLWVRKQKLMDIGFASGFQSRLQDAELAEVFLSDGIEWLKAARSPNMILRYLLAAPTESLKPVDCESQLFTGCPQPVDCGLALPTESSPEPVQCGLELPTEFSPSVLLAFEDTFDFTNYSRAPECTQNCLYLVSSQFRQPFDLLESLLALEVAANIYQTMPQATVSLQIIEHSLTTAKWFCPPAAAERSAEEYFKRMTRAELFACVGMFESGRFNIEPSDLADVIALCSEDSIYVADILLSDPCANPPELRIRHLVGNVGQSGMVCLVSPTRPRIRQIGHDALLVSHPVFDGACTDSFKGTSLHLSFTNWKVPLDPGPKGEIDQEIFLLESVVSVQEQGRWVADIDVLGVERSRKSGMIDTISFSDCDCHESREPLPSKHWDAVSIGSWEELLDQPPCTGVVQTSNNEVARLAAVSILAQKDMASETAVLKGARFCWKCCRTMYSRAENRPHIIIL